MAALKNARVTGGHIPGRTAPDISMAGNPGAIGAIRDAISRQDGLPAIPAVLPPDPFGHDTAPAIALAELYNDMIGAGIPLASVERILGATLAAMGKDEKP